MLKFEQRKKEKGCVNKEIHENVAVTNRAGN